MADGQNTSAAVMAQRVEPDDSLDYFPTPPWATRALVEHVLTDTPWRRDRLASMTCLEPACGGLYMARPLGEYFGEVTAADVHDYGGHRVADFLFSDPVPARPDFVITNPPFRLAVEFIRRGLDIARHGVAVLVRTSFMEGGTRWRELFGPRPPAIFAPFAERVIMHKGILRDPSVRYWDESAGVWRKPSTATAYCWLVWTVAPVAAPVVRWIPPCYATLARPDDWPAVAQDDAAGPLFGDVDSAGAAS